MQPIIEGDFILTSIYPFPQKCPISPNFVQILPKSTIISLTEHELWCKKQSEISSDVLMKI